MNRTSVEPNIGKWARFDGYEIVDGYIRRRSKAPCVEYDPWALYRAQRDAGGDTAPYVPLLAALEEMEAGEDGLPTRGLRPAEEDAVLGWCRQYGLLGVLVHQVSSVTLAPRWEFLYRLGGQPEPESGVDHQLRVQSRYVRTPSGWLPGVTVIVPKDGSMKTLPVGSPGELVSDDTLSSFDKPSAVVLPAGSGPITVEPLEGRWARYFPNIAASEANTFNYPCPGTVEFWNLYAEPVDDFVAAVLRLRAAIRAATVSKSKANGSVEGFASLVSPVGMVVVQGRDAPLDTAWVHSTLLASLASMAVSDMSGNRRLRRCRADGCGELFISAAWQAKYCSPRCSKRMEMRNYRKKKAKKQTTGGSKAKRRVVKRR